MTDESPSGDANMTDESPSVNVNMTDESPVENPKKRKRDDVSSSAPQKSWTRILWDQFVAMGLPLHIQEEAKKWEPIVRG